MIRRTLVSASTSSQLSEWVLSPRACVSGLRTCPNQRLHLFRRQEVLRAALVAAVTADQVTAATLAIRLVPGHARALNLHLDVAEREALAVRFRALHRALAHAHHLVARGTGATHVRPPLRGLVRILAGNEREATQSLARLRPAARDLEVIRAPHRHHARELGVIHPRQYGIAVSAVLAHHRAVAQGLHHTTLALLRARRRAVAVIADRLRPAARDRCLLVVGIPAQLRDLHRVRHLWRSQWSTILWRTSTLHAVA